VGIQRREKCYLSIGVDFIDRSSRPLKIRGVIEVTDQYAALLQPTNGGWHDGYAIRVDIAIGRNRGPDRLNVSQALDERMPVVVGARGECYKSYES
jgi:hypothetical protein